MGLMAAAVQSQRLQTPVDFSPWRRVDRAIEGMGCAGCGARVEAGGAMALSSLGVVTHSFLFKRRDRDSAGGGP